MYLWDEKFDNRNVTLRAQSYDLNFLSWFLCRKSLYFGPRTSESGDADKPLSSSMKVK